MREPFFRHKNAKLATNLLALTLGMLMLAYASVPLYRLFCNVTGFGGTTKTAGIRTHSTMLNRIITVRFNAETDAKLPWEFKPDQNSVQVKVGEEKLVSYLAKNLSNKPITGRAVYNVVPFKAGAYFMKIECFCFQNQILNPNESVHMPISFFLDPSLADDPDMKDVKEITLSYTFFPATSKEDD